MTMHDKHKKYLIVILILAMILAVKAAGYRDMEQDNDATSGDLSIESYTLNADVGSVEPTIKDIFAGTTRRESIASIQSVSGRKKTVSLPKREPTLQTENQALPPINDGEISRLKLLGIVFHDNKKKAFLALDSQRVIADVGDLVYGRYLLQEITVDSASLIDTTNNVSKTILVSGK